MDTKETIILARKRMGDVIHDVRNHLLGLDGQVARENFESIKKYHGKDRTDKLREKLNELNKSWWDLVNLEKSL